MRKFLLTLLIGALLLMTGARAATYTYAQRFSFDYPDGWTLDDTSYLDESEGDYTWVADAYGEDYYLTVSMEIIDGWAGFSLFGADEAGVERYKRDLLGDYAAYGAAYVDTWSDATGRIPFIVLQTEGGTLLAATMASGQDIRFEMEAADGEPASAMEDALRAILSSFVPVR